VAILQSDLLGRQISVLGKIPQLSMVGLATTALFTTPSGTWSAAGSALRTFVLAIVLDNPNAAAGGTLTASAGSGATATDFVGSGSITVPTGSLATVVLFAVATGVIYATGQVINFKITVAGTGACDVTALGWTE
jgi:hypothetical protein